MKLASLSLSLAAVALFANAAFAQVNVYFANQTGEAANVEWLNGNSRQFYMTVPPGETRGLQSYQGHRWEMSNRSSTSGATVTQENQVISLTGYQAAPPVPQFEQPRPQFEQPQPQPQPAVSSVNQGVVNFAQSVLGQRIGSGQCTELAIAALRAAGAQPNQGYTWGTQLRGVADLQPGDIIQMHDARFEYPNGSSAWSTGPHTAVVASVEGNVIRVLEQNIGGSPVQAGQYDVRYLTAGRVEFYRPVAANHGPAQANVFGRQNVQPRQLIQSLPQLPRRFSIFE